MINVEGWAEIRRLNRAEGLGSKPSPAGSASPATRFVPRCARIARRPMSARKGSILNAVEPQILELLREFPDMPATVVAERVGWERSVRVLRDRAAELRPLFVPPDPCQRTDYRPGELA